MRDGVTLGWKLDLVLRGLADESLLDSYEAERRPHATAITEISTALGKVANTHDSAAAAARDQAFRDGTAPPPPPFPTIVAGVISHSPDGAPAPLAGTLTPQGVVRKDDAEGLFDDVVGRGFSLVAAADPHAVLTAAQLEFLGRLDVTSATIAPGTSSTGPIPSRSPQSPSNWTRAITSIRRSCSTESRCGCCSIRGLPAPS